MSVAPDTKADLLSMAWDGESVEICRASSRLPWYSRTALALMVLVT